MDGSDIIGHGNRNQRKGEVFGENDLQAVFQLVMGYGKAEARFGATGRAEGNDQNQG